MKVIIDHRGKHVCVGLRDRDIVTAGWLGFRFARDNPDLTDEGWTLGYFPDSYSRFQEPNVLEVRHETSELVNAIRKGPPCTHSCPRHEAVVEPKCGLSCCRGAETALPRMGEVE